VSEPTTAKKKTSIAAWIGLILFMGGLIALAVFFRDLFGSDVGGPCTAENDCKRGRICISKKCYRECKVDADCGAGWACGSTDVSISPDGNPAKGFELSSVNVCFTEEQMAPARARAMAKKKESVRGWVTQTMVSRKLSAAEFDAAWEQIPEEERRTAKDTDLATRVMALAKPK
jgi:hypothetical protein